jgi:hypothetical protein
MILTDGEALILAGKDIHLNNVKGGSVYSLNQEIDSLNTAESELSQLSALVSTAWSQIGEQIIMLR